MRNITAQELFEAYAATIDTIGSGTKYRRRQSDVKRLREFVATLPDGLVVEDISMQHLHDYAELLRSKNMKEASVWRVMNVLRTCLNRTPYLFPDDLGGYLPPSRPPTFQEYTPRTDILNRETFDRLVATLGMDSDSNEWTRQLRSRKTAQDYLILLAAQPDLPPPALVALKWEDAKQMEWLEPAAKVLERRAHGNTSPYVFPSYQIPDAPLDRIHIRSLRAACAALGLHWGRGVGQLNFQYIQQQASRWS